MKNSIYYAVSLALFTSACSAPTGITEQSKKLQAPNQWQDSGSIAISNQSKFWIENFSDPTLESLVAKAVSNNREFKINKIAVKIAEERAAVAGADLWPDLTIGASQSRRKTVANDNASYSNAADIDLQLSYEVDLWGKLSDAQEEATLSLASARNTLKYQETQLVSNVSSAWFNLIEARQLLNLYQERATNLAHNLEMIQAGYRLGLNQALDVYLTQNDVNRELARVAEQTNAVKRAQRDLELLIGDYPEANLASANVLPKVDTSFSFGEPSELLTQRYDIQSAWFDMLSADAGLAVAHKQRFPKFSLTATAGDSSDELSNLLSGSSLAWSLLGNLTMPLFDGGRLSSLEEQAKLMVQQKEQTYLDKVYRAFAEVENTISTRKSLAERYTHFTAAQENALAAEKLSFEQYMKGLVTYTTVLESQRRAFDAQTTVIQLTNQIIQNKIALHVALGGSPYQTVAQNQANEEL